VLSCELDVKKIKAKIVDKIIFKIIVV
jgi:hypothetical protein